MSAGPRCNLYDAAVEYAARHQQQCHTDDGHGQRLVLAVTIVVRLVLRLIADAYEDDDDGIGHEIAERMDGISHHSGTVAEDAGHKLEDQQHHVDDAAYERYLVDFLTAFHFCCNCLVLMLLPLCR